ncbi:MAG: sulfur carrier protein ThiS [Crocinitomicaceae bacterium]
MIEVSINSQNKTIAKNTSLEELLAIINQSKNGIAIAINNQVVPKNDWPNFHLNANDKLLIIKATQGG